MDPQFLPQLTGILYCAVVFFVGFECFPLAVEAERFMGEPVTSLYIPFAFLIEGLIAAAGEPLSVFQNRCKAVLFGLCGVNVKKGYRVVQNPLGLAVMDRDQVNAVADKFEKFTLNRQAADGGDGLRQVLVAVDVEISLILVVFHAGGNDPDEPYDPKKVVRVLVGDEDVVDPAKIHVHILQDPQDAVAAAGVDHKKLLLGIF